MNRKVILMILDGWGIAKDKSVSAIDQANTPFIDSLYQKYSHAKLEASGLAVGLPEGQMGNSEVGHMNLGAGRVVYQMLVRINKELAEGTLAQNTELNKLVEYAKTKNKKVHLLGLLSDGGVHSHIDHLKGLVDILEDKGVPNTYIHAFTDGRDTDPKGGVGYVQELQQHLQGKPAKLACIIGRYYAMDRDKRWERVKEAYDLLVNSKGKLYYDPVKALQDSYAEGITDEFVKPVALTNNDGTPVANIKAGDVVLFFNFRTDRGRELTHVLTQQDMPEQGMTTLPLYYATMTQYDESFRGVHVLIHNQEITETLGEVLAAHGKRQIRIAETEKYPHVTFFFNCGREEPFEGEERIMCPSPKVATYDLQPEMSAYDVRDRIIARLKTEEPDFVCLNFANPDMVGHTGVFEAAVKACETVDICARDVINTALEHGYSTIVIADHGNSDCLVNPDGSPNTAHTTNPVPFILVDKQYHQPLKDGKLGDMAPTILQLMGLKKPQAMTGKSLLYQPQQAHA